MPEGKTLEEVSLETPQLFLAGDHSKEAEEAYCLMRKSCIPHERYMAACDLPGLDDRPSKPVLVVGYSRYTGINEIRTWVTENEEIYKGVLHRLFFKHKKSKRI